MLRSTFALSFQIIYLNKGLKAAVWDGIDRGKVGILATRTMLGVTRTVISYVIVKQLPLSYLAIEINMTPIATLILAYVILRERITFFDLSMISLTMIGLMVVIFNPNPDVNKNSSEKQEERQAQTSQITMYLIYAALLVKPFCSAYSSIALRQMQKFHSAVVSWYMSLVMLIFSLFVILASNSDLRPLLQWDSTSWALAMGAGLFSMWSTTVKFVASKHEKASKLQML